MVAHIEVHFQLYMYSGTRHTNQDEQSLTRTIMIRFNDIHIIVSDYPPYYL